MNKQHEFKQGEKVIFTPENEIYDFGYMSQTGHAIIYEQGENNMQDSHAVDFKNLKKLNQ